MKSHTSLVAQQTRLSEEVFGVRPCAQLRAYNPAGGNPVK